MEKKIMREKSIVLNIMQGEPGEILEKGRYYCVRKLPNGLVHAEYCNSSQETAALKLTLTALAPYAQFTIQVQKEAPSFLRANAAGILEGHFQVPGGRRIDIDERKKEEE